MTVKSLIVQAPGASIVIFFTAAVNISIVQQASAFVIVNHFYWLFIKHTGFLCYGINYGRNKFYDTGLRDLEPIL